MSWKQELQLRDIDLELHKLEAICTICQHIHYIDVKTLLQQKHMEFKYIEEIERDEICRARLCHGKCRLSLTHSHETEAFVGGLA